MKKACSKMGFSGHKCLGLFFIVVAYLSCAVVRCSAESISKTCKEGEELVGNRCEILEGQKCKLLKRCAKFSICILGVCRCQKGYSPNLNGQCSLDYGQNCNSSITVPADNPASPILHDTCNQAKFLTCSSGKCVCNAREKQSYDSVQKKCVGKFGAQCDSSGTRFAPCKQSKYLYCKTPANEINGMCSCKNGTIFSQKRDQCIIQYIPPNELSQGYSSCQY